MKQADTKKINAIFIETLVKLDKYIELTILERTEQDLEKLQTALLGELPTENFHERFEIGIFEEGAAHWILEQQCTTLEKVLSVQKFVENYIENN